MQSRLDDESFVLLMLFGEEPDELDVLSPLG